MGRRAPARLVLVAVAALATACTRPVPDADPGGTVVAPAPGAASSSPAPPGGASTTSVAPAPTPTASTPTAPTSTGSTTAPTSTGSTTAPTSTTAATLVPDTTLLPAPVTVDPPAPGSTGSLREIRPASDIPPPPIPAAWVVETIGTTVRGRPIESWSRRVPDARHVVVVIGAVHGNEPASPPTVRALVTADVPDDVEIWLVPELNADGVAEGTRWNANGVDLNRNFPWGWLPEDGGPGPLSEPEAQAAVELIERVGPDVVVWVHQPYGYVTSVGGSDDRLEQAWSLGSGLEVRPDVRQHGGGESWTHFAAGLDSMLIEMDTWGATEAMVAAQVAGFESLLASLD